MIGETNITLNSIMSSIISPVIYLICLFFEKMIKPKNASPNANKPHLSRDIEYLSKNKISIDTLLIISGSQFLIAMQL